MSLHLTNTTRNRTKLPYLELKNEILGAGDQLSLSLIGEKRAKEGAGPIHE